MPADTLPAPSSTRAIAQPALPVVSRPRHAAAPHDGRPLAPSTRAESGIRGLGSARQSFVPRISAPRSGRDHPCLHRNCHHFAGSRKSGFEELVSFSSGLLGIAFNIDKDEVGVVLLGDYQSLHAGDEVTRTGRVMDDWWARSCSAGS